MSSRPDNPKRLGKRNNDKNKKVPEGVARGDQEDGSRAEIKRSPEKSADAGGQDKHEIAAARMNKGIESC